MASAQNTTRVETVVIGGGQAGLSVGYHLAQQGIPFVILDAHSRIGDAWRTRWDSLRLFTPARYDGLPGLRFPAKGDEFPTKDQMADFLESYAAQFNLPVRTGMKVDRLSRKDGRFVVSAGGASFEAENVVVAMGSHQKPRVPGLCARARSEDRAAAFARLPESFAAEGRRRPHRRCRELWCGYRFGSGSHPSDVAGREGVRPRAVPYRNVCRAIHPRQDCSIHRSSRADRGHTDRSTAASETSIPGGAADPSEAAGSSRGRD